MDPIKDPAMSNQILVANLGHGSVERDGTFTPTPNWLIIEGSTPEMSIFI
jgi:hypothetical protein